MTDDPRAADRQRLEEESRPTTRLPERVAEGLSPADDKLAFPVAVRNRDDMAKTAKAFGKRTRIKRQETRLGCTVAVLGEVFAIRRELFEPAPDNIINDDFYIAMRIIKRGLRVVYVPEAISRERVSPSAEDEITRRTRMVAGLYQALVRPRELMPWKKPVVCWQLVSHKFMRPLVPLWMIAALATNVALALQTGTSPWSGLLAGQVVFYALALVGLQYPADGRVSRALYLPTFLVASNLAALLGLYRFSTGQQSTQWTRLRRRV